jgi:hypothetical protein
MAVEFQEHERLVDGSAAHPLGDGAAESLVGGGVVRGHSGWGVTGGGTCGSRLVSALLMPSPLGEPALAS